jgi:hypothetical protein
MTDPDLNAMSEEERRQYLSSLSWDELLKRAGGQKTYRHVNGPAWKSLTDKQCHICHKPITDERSLRVKIGGSDCRPRIEHELKRGPEMWDQVSADELENIWTTFNIYGIYINDVAHKVMQVHKKQDLVIFDPQDTDQVLVKIGSQMTLSSREAARKLWKERT